ncbi:MAG: carboxy terminal-processing peptidase [Burkholderiales bacterium]|nr:carboxy terminal-processing peptidase [Burkholderiales bacterium]
MKLKLLGLLFACITAAHSAPIVPDAQAAKAASMAADLLSRYHYKPTPVDEALSGKIFDQYLKALDPEKLFFIQADIDELAPARSKLGTDMLNGELGRPFEIFNLYVKRAVERLAFARNLLKGGFTFDSAESYQFVRNKQGWSKTEADVLDLWRKRVKNDWLRLKLAGKDDKSIVDLLGKRYDNSLKRLGRLNNEDAFNTYMNAYTMAIEPHTNYMAPRTAANFDISMRLSLVGIGAVLVEVDEYTTIRELMAGGPAALSGQLKVGDRIVGVAQGDAGTMTDIMGARLDDSVTLIRGAADTVVRLEVLPADAGPDGKHKVVSLVRKPISLQDQSAKSSVQTITDGALTRKIGVITLPSFYEDFAAKQKGISGYKSTSRDVAVLIKELKDKKVDAILMDLRNNGGGSLSEAIELTGFFTGKGPVVQVRDAKGQIRIESSPQSQPAWEGPLAVLINRNSASASEIFAAAIQDYGRGLVLGEPSFGKGTVQTMINLDRIAKSEKPQLGEIKLTIAQFFRINGGTTQLRGVTPDVTFPTVMETGEHGESSYDNALPWVQIPAAKFSPNGTLQDLLPILVGQHKLRVKNEKDFQYLQEDIAEFNLKRKRNELSLNEAERRKEKQAQEAKLAARKAGTKAKDGDDNIKNDVAKDDGLQAGERDLSVELAAEKARKNDKDVLLIEAAHILGDSVALLKPGVNLAARAKQAQLLNAQ